MKVLINDKPVDNSFVGDAFTLEDALRHVQSHLCPRNHLVIGLRCDGRDVAADTMAATLRRKAASVEQLELLTGTKALLVIDAMTQASACLTQTEEACTQIVRMLNQGRIAEGAEALGGCLRIWQQIHEAVVKSLQMLELDPEQITIRDEPLLQLLSRPKEVLVQIRDALTGKDYVLLADLLQYEFTEVTETWHSAVARIRQDAEESRARASG